MVEKHTAMEELLGLEVDSSAAAAAAAVVMGKQ